MKNKISSYHQYENAILTLARTFSLWQVFDDFLDYALIMLRWWDLRPASFIELEKKYTEPSQQRLFAEAFFAMTDVADNYGNGFKDPFGDFYMEHLSNERKGQFFTPEALCDMTARMIIGDILPDNATVMDPCCGSGRLLLSAGKLNRKAIFYGADLDLTCCKMTVLNMLLNSLCGEIAWMNSLSLEHWKSWHLKKVMDGNGRYLPYYIETNISNIVTHQPSDTNNPPSIKTPLVEKLAARRKIPKNGQLSFFFE